MKSAKWVKIETSFFEDKRMNRIRKKNKANWCEVVCFYFQLLTLAGKCNKSGALVDEDSELYDVDLLNAETRVPEEKIEEYLQELESFKFINIVNGAICIADWNDVQNEDKLAEYRETSKKSSKKYRDRMKRVTSCVTSRDAIERELEKEKEKEGDASPKKDIDSIPSHSFDSESATLKEFLISGTKEIEKLIDSYALVLSVHEVIEGFIKYWDKQNRNYEGTRSHNGILSSLKNWVEIETKKPENINTDNKKFDSAKEVFDHWSKITYFKLNKECTAGMLKLANKILASGEPIEEIKMNLDKIKELGSIWRQAYYAFENYENLKAMKIEVDTYTMSNN